MLIDFSVQNFLSFSSLTKLSLEATSVREQTNSTFSPYNYEFDYRLLKSVALYGYNSSGKSNILKAIGLMKYAVLYSFGNPNNIFVQEAVPFLLNTTNVDQPSRFEVVFFTNKKKYRYGFEVLKGRVENEWLFHAEPKVKEVRLFTRTKNIISSNKNWNKESGGMLESLSTLVKENILFLSVLGQLNIQPAVEIFKWFSNIIIVEQFNIDFFIDKTASMLEDDVYKFNLLSIIKSAELGFSNIKKEEEPEKNSLSSKYTNDFLSMMLKSEFTHKAYKVLTRHDVYNDSRTIVGNNYFNIREQESTGTKKFFGLLGLFLNAVINGNILLIDEIDSRLHSTLLEALLSFFNSQEYNTKGAQLIFTSHNTYLLKDKKLRRDQIYLTEKNHFGESTIKRIHGGKAAIRTDEVIEKNYYEGKYSDQNNPKPGDRLFTGKLDFPDF